MPHGKDSRDWLSLSGRRRFGEEGGGSSSHTQGGKVSEQEQVAQFCQGFHTFTLHCIHFNLQRLRLDSVGLYIQDICRHPLGNSTDEAVLTIHVSPALMPAKESASMAILSTAKFWISTTVQHVQRVGDRD